MAGHAAPSPANRRSTVSAIRTYDGAVALITGGASGIGAALSRQLAGRGATVVVADRQVELARATAGALRRPGEAHELDVRDAAAFDWLLEDLFARHGRLDYLFNNAGTGGGVYGGMKIAIPAPAQLAMWERLRPMDADRFAEAVVRDVARDVPIIIYPRWWRALRWLDRLAPSVTDALTARGFVRAKAELEALAASAPDGLPNENRP